jgi:hypothetical protein
MGKGYYHQHDLSEQLKAYLTVSGTALDLAEKS